MDTTEKPRRVAGAQPRITLTVLLRPQQYEALRERAHRDDVPATSIVRKALDRYLSQPEDH